MLPSSTGAMGFSKVLVEPGLRGECECGRLPLVNPRDMVVEMRLVRGNECRRYGFPKQTDERMFRRWSVLCSSFGARLLR